MKQIIRLTESDLHKVVKSSVKRILKEINEGTPKQIPFLQRLMGDRWKDEYANLSVSDTSKMIDQELANQKKNQQSNVATEKQIAFIESNKYFPIPSIRQIEGKLTMEDAKTLLDALNPYTYGAFTYYGHSREKKERWLPRLKEVVVPILERYGLTQEAQRVTQYVDDFMGKHNAKLEREKQKKLAQEMEELKSNPSTLRFISTQDERYPEMNTDRISREIYMEGALEKAMGWDIAAVITDGLNITKEDIMQRCMQLRGASYPALVEGYDKPCRAIFWVGYLWGRLDIAGRIVDKDEAYKYVKYAQEHNGKEIEDFDLTIDDK